MADIEQIIRTGFHHEIDLLVPADLAVPPAPVGPIGGRKTTAKSISTTRGWKLPALAASAVVAVTAGVVMLHHHQGPAAAGSSTSSNVVVASEGTMPDSVHEHAVALLTKWNTQLGQDPKLTTPFDVISVPMGTPASETATTSGNVLSVTFTGVENGKNQDCGYGYSAAVVEASHAVAVFIVADPGTWPHGYNIGCADVGKQITVRAPLSRPLSGRAVLDAFNGRNVPVT